jgi:hypothetical protein
MTNNKQQTAVDSIIAKLNNVKPTEFCSIETIKEWCEQAKEMEKEQIEDAFGIGCQVESTRLIGYQDIAEQYYNETYGGNK